MNKVESFEKLLGLDVTNKMSQNRVDLFNKEFKSYELLQDGAAKFEKQSGEQVEFSFLELLAWLPSPKQIPSGRNVVWFGRVDSEGKEPAEQIAFVQTAAAYRRAAMLPIDSNELYNKIEYLLTSKQRTKDELVNFLHELQDSIFPEQARQTYIFMLEQEQAVLSLEQYGIIFADNACYLDKDRNKCYVATISSVDWLRNHEAITTSIDLIEPPKPLEVDKTTFMPTGFSLRFRVKGEQNEPTRRESDK